MIALVSIGITLVVLLVLFLATYRIVSPSEAHIIVSPWGKKVCTPDIKLADGGNWYIWLPFLMQVRVLDITIKELAVKQETYEKGQARYNVHSSIKYRINDPKKAAETFVNDETLNQMLQDIITAAVRAVTVKYDVNDARAFKKKMGEEIMNEIQDDLAAWGVEMTNFQLVDFQDTGDSKIISNISRRREVDIESATRQENAEKLKQAVVKEAESMEVGRKREIQRDEEIGKRLQQKEKTVFESERDAQEQKMTVVRVQTIKQAEIDKDKAVIFATQMRDAEEINKQQKKLLGEGDRVMKEEQAKGEAAPIREKGFAEADAKDKLQQALNKFGNSAITALVAEKVVEMQKTVGVANAEAWSKADVKAFIGGEGSNSGFDIGKVMTGLQTTNESMAASVLNKIARPNDLGLVGFNPTDMLPKPTKKVNVPKLE
jgi:flotillin